MVEDDDHGARVDAWLERGAKDLPPDRLLLAFEAAFAAMWRRAYRTLGDVTLTAIVDRVLRVAAEQYPTLSSITVDATGLRCEELHQRAGSLQADPLVEELRFVLVEFLTVLGTLTDEILTPALHDALAEVAPAEEGGAAES